MTTKHTYQGITLTTKEWAIRLGLKKATFWTRLTTMTDKDKIFSPVILRKPRRQRQWHGASRTQTYNAWHNMLRRCTDPTSKRYHRYGGRGIKVCSRWKLYRNFLADMGEAPKGLTLERIDNDGDYTPSNCCWATTKQQAQNNSRNIKLNYKGKEYKTLQELTEALGLIYGRVRRRIRVMEMPLEKAISLGRIK